MKKFKLVPHKKYPGMFWIKYPDGELSNRFYNKTWAKEHISVILANIDAPPDLECPSEALGSSLMR